MGYIFDPEVLLQIAREALGQPTEAMVAQIADELASRYPGHILTEREWIFSNAGGAMGAMMVLHASLTEYVIVFGTAIGTEGATGRFAAEDHFIMLEGEQWSFSEGDLDRTVTKPGEVAVLRRGQAKAFRFPDKAWGLEYARGAIPAMLPFGLADTFTSTLDFDPLLRTIRVYAKGTLMNLARGKL